MTPRMIIWKLGRAGLPLSATVELSLHVAVPGSLGICMTVADIIRDYNPTIEKEQVVYDLLSELLRLHFSSKTAKRLRFARKLKTK